MGRRARRKELGRATDPGLPARQDGRTRGLLVALLMPLPEGKEQLALPAEMVIQAADARPGPLDYIGNARLGEPLPGENVTSRIQQRALGLRGAPPLPGTVPRLPRLRLGHRLVSPPLDARFVS